MIDFLALFFVIAAYTLGYMLGKKDEREEKEGGRNK